LSGSIGLGALATVYGSIRTASTVETAGTIRTAGTIMTAGTVMTASTIRTAGTVRTADAVKTAGTVRTSGTVRTARIVRTSGTVKTARIVRTAGTIRTTKTARISFYVVCKQYFRTRMYSSGHYNIHLGAPYSIIDYVQKTGRAGRSEEMAVADIIIEEHNWPGVKDTADDIYGEQDVREVNVLIRIRGR
jgi:hypothetical protein